MISIFCFIILTIILFFTLKKYCSSDKDLSQKNVVLISIGSSIFLALIVAILLDGILGAANKPIEKQHTSEFVATQEIVALRDNSINHTNFYVNKSIDNTIKILESGAELVVFWFFWILLIGGCVFAFVYFENKWLEDKNQTTC